MGEDSECHINTSDSELFKQAYLPLEQQISILVDKLSAMLAELDALVQQIEIPETASTRTQVLIESLSAYMRRPREQLQAIQNTSFLAFKCDPVFAVFALADCALVWVNCALKVARPLAVKGKLKRRELDELDSALGEVFGGFERIHEVVLGDAEASDTSVSTE